MGGCASKDNAKKPKEDETGFVLFVSCRCLHGSIRSNQHPDACGRFFLCLLVLCFLCLRVLDESTHFTQKMFREQRGISALHRVKPTLKHATKKIDASFFVSEIDSPSKPKRWFVCLFAENQTQWLTPLFWKSWNPASRNWKPPTRSLS